MKPRTISILIYLLVLSACSSATPIQQPVPTAEPSSVAVVAVATATASPTMVLPTPFPSPTATPQRVAQAAPVSDLVAEQVVPSPTTQPGVIPTPTPRPSSTPPRVGLQIGHLRSNELPAELAHLRTSTGTYWQNIREVEVNEAIAIRVRDILVAAGVEVDLLPATVPPSYDADAFVAIHADGSTAGTRGWKVATPWRTSAASRALMEAVASTYGVITGLPEDRHGISINMRGYYAFNYRRHTHAIARTTPAIIVETGFLTNAADRTIIVDRPDLAAQGIAEGILKYLNQRDPNDGAALLPPEWPILYTSVEAVVRAAPSAQARIIVQAPPDSRVFVFNQEGDWYEAMVRVGDTRYVGWLRVDQTRPATPADNPSAPPAEAPATNP